MRSAQPLAVLVKMMFYYQEIVQHLPPFSNRQPNFAISKILATRLLTPAEHSSNLKQIDRAPLEEASSISGEIRSSQTVLASASS